MAVAGEGGQTVLTDTIVAGVRVAFIDVNLTMLPCVTWRKEEKSENPRENGGDDDEI